MMYILLNERLTSGLFVLKKSWVGRQNICDHFALPTPFPHNLAVKRESWGGGSCGCALSLPLQELESTLNYSQQNFKKMPGEEAR